MTAAAAARSPRTQREVRLSRITHAGERVRCWRTTPYTGHCMAGLQRVETECVTRPHATYSMFDVHTYRPHPDDDDSSSYPPPPPRNPWRRY